MDAATLYTVLTLANGEQSTSTVDFSTLWKCEQKIVWLELIERRHHQPPGAVTSYRCAEHEIGPIFLLIACDRRHGGSCEHFKLSSRRGCTAFRWVIYMRDRSRTARCRGWPRSTDATEPEREPNLPDFLDMWGQPGQK
jgi:hypothetical protein